MIRTSLLVVALFCLCAGVEVLDPDCSVEARGPGGRGGNGNKGGKGGKGPKGGIKVDTMPDWKQQRISTFADAFKAKSPVVLVFVDSKTALNAAYMANADYASLSREKAVFVKVVQGQKILKEEDDESGIKMFGEDDARASEEEKKEMEEKKKVEWVEDVPTYRIIQDDLWAAYNLEVGNHILVCDYHGNVYKDYTKKPPTASTLEKEVEKVAKKAEKANEDLKKATEKAKEKFEKGDVAKTVEIMVKAFEDKLCGLDACKDAGDFFTKVITEGKKKVDEVIASGDKGDMKKLAKVYLGTSLEKQLNDAINGEKPADGEKKDDAEAKAAK